VAAETPTCTCGRFAVGVCVDCRTPLCERHLVEVRESIVCTSCGSARAKASEERAARRRQSGLLKEVAQVRAAVDGGVSGETPPGWVLFEYGHVALVAEIAEQDLGDEAQPLDDDDDGARFLVQVLCWWPASPDLEWDATDFEGSNYDCDECHAILRRDDQIVEILDPWSRQDHVQVAYITRKRDRLRQEAREEVEDRHTKVTQAMQVVHWNGSSGVLCGGNRGDRPAQASARQLCRDCRQLLDEMVRELYQRKCAAAGLDP